MPRRKTDDPTSSSEEEEDDSSCDSYEKFRRKDVFYCCEYAASSRTTCTASGKVIPKGQIRIAYMTASRYGDSHVPEWYLPEHLPLHHRKKIDPNRYGMGKLTEADQELMKKLPGTGKLPEFPKDQLFGKRVPGAGGKKGKPKHKKGKGPCGGMRVMVVGRFGRTRTNALAKALIEDNGGEVTEVPGKTTHVLIHNSYDALSTKAQAAVKTQKVTVLTGMMLDAIDRDDCDLEIGKMTEEEHKQKCWLVSPEYAMKKVAEAEAAKANKSQKAAEAKAAKAAEEEE